MADISTKYMGLTLKSPIIASSSDFTSNIDQIVKLANAGCGAIVLKSIFEEQIRMEIDSLQVNNMFNTYTDTENYISYYTKKHELDKHIQLIKEAKKQVDIPIIASIHCSTSEGWTEYVNVLEKAGADAIELNIFILPSDSTKSATDIEQVYFSILDNVRKQTGLPIALKMHHYFTDMAHIANKFADKVDSLVLFNRFFNPDIDIKEEKVKSAGSFSEPSDNYFIQRWLGILRPIISKSLSASGGIHDSEAVIKNLLAGADVVQIASVLYKNDISIIAEMNKDIAAWMEQKNYKTLDDFKSKLSYWKIGNAANYERAQFMKYFSSNS